MKKTFLMHIGARQETYQDHPDFYLHMNDMSEYGYVEVNTTEVTVDIPDNFDIRQPMVALLEQKRLKAIADHQMLMNAIDGQIQQLLCLEHVDHV